MVGGPSSGGGIASVPEEYPQPDAVREQMQRLLGSPLFRNSSRCRPFLLYVVTEMLEGRAGDLKERRIGTDVFEREPDYDTSTDPIVRTTAIDVRRRLAQYYQHPSHAGEIRIDLPVGHYAPEFRFQRLFPAADPAGEQPVACGPERNRKRHFRKRGFLWAAVLVVALATAGTIIRTGMRDDPVDMFWHRMWGAADPTTLVLGDAMNGYFSEAPRTAENSRDTRVSFADSIALAQVAAMLQANGKRFEFRLAGSTNLGDLKRAPAVLIGALNNSWSMGLQDQLRFSIHWDNDRVWIQDSKKPDVPLYSVSVDREKLYSKNRIDYAIVARFADPRTQQPVLILAGLGGGGTRAAAEFVTQSRYLNALAATAPRGWERKNLEVVLGVDMVNGITGSPRVLTVHLW